MIVFLNVSMLKTQRSGTEL